MSYRSWQQLVFDSIKEEEEVSILPMALNTSFMKKIPT